MLFIFIPIFSFLADRTAARIMIGYWHHINVVCLSVCRRRCAVWINIHSYSKSV